MRDRVRRALTGYAPRTLPLAGRRESAVMLLLYPHDGEDCLVFQVRTQHVAHHRGEISLPGGGRDPEDHSLAETALRETHEEIGIPAELVEVLGQLDDTDTRASNYRITPFVGALRVDADVAASAYAPREVHQLLYVPVAHLLSPASRTWKVVEADGAPVATAAFQHDEHLIWGATARIITSFVELMERAR
ncbi:MAG: CoA pyrophosphatase [Chloroflexi bacterium]|nr:CoA pyrophosphatase [Chloroflexota bacterium]MDA1003796.1 CoA pyrophosphatase [Chloroflexota bacterium]